MSAASSSRRWRIRATSRSRARCATRRSSTRSCSPATRCSESRYRPSSSARCAAATARPSWSRPTPPIPSRPAPRSAPDSTAPPFEIRQHARYNPGQVSALNIVPGLLGTILTLTMLIFTALSVTREVERGTMENLLSMPIDPLEIMLGKITPYIVIGFLQATLIVAAAVFLFKVPLLGDVSLLAALSTLFIATNLSVGYTFSTLAQNQLQAIQMAMMYFLPNMLLSGFLFPFAGMPLWAQWVGETLPLTHFVRIVRAIMLKGASLSVLHFDVAALAGLMLIAMTIAVLRFRRTLD